MSDRERRSSRREERRARAGTQIVSAVKPLVNKLPLTEVLSPEGVEAVHRASMRLLQDPGILIIDYPPARETFKANGATVEGELVRIDEDTLMHFIRQAPTTFTQLARNPANS